MYQRSENVLSRSRRGYNYLSFLLEMSLQGPPRPTLLVESQNINKL